MFTSFSSAANAAGTARYTFEGLGFLTEPKPPVDRVEGLLRADYERRFRVSRFVDFELHPFARVSTLKESRQEQALLDPRELYLEWHRSGNFARAGFLTMKWEGTDGLNPMDIASVKDWSDPLATQTKASAGLQFGRNGDAYDIEMAWIPVQTRSSLPGEKSAWLPRELSLPVRSSEAEFRLPDRVEYVYLPRRELNDALKNAFATRVQYRGDFGDAALGFYEGAADMPTLIPTLNAVTVPGQPYFQLVSPIEIRAVDYRTRAVSGVTSVTAGNWILRAAARYDQPLGNDPLLPTWSQSTVAGVERTFQIGENAVTALLQGSLVRKPEGSGLMSVSDIFDKTVLYGIRFPYGENWLFFVSGFNNTKDKSYYTKEEIGYRWSDHWRTDFALEFLDGPSGSLLGAMGKNDRATVGLTGVF